ncbi:hypothetical protein O9992_17445 [Vibrio lentus]|nr:hypothetical protein [Vibrio lentus]
MSPPAMMIHAYVGLYTNAVANPSKCSWTTQRLRRQRCANVVSLGTAMQSTVSRLYWVQT